MTTVTDAKLVTAEEFRKLEFDVPVDLVRGEIIEMTRPGGIPGFVCSNVATTLTLWDRPRRHYYVVSNDADVLTERNPDSVRGRTSS